MFKWLRRKQPKRDRWDPETPLLRWNAWDAFTIGDSYEGLFAAGRTGSGKSSTTGKQLAMAMLAAGYGGLVLTVKAGEAELWNDFCRRTGRQDDLCVVDSSCRWRFDFLQALQDSQGTDSGLVENIVALLMEVGQVGSRQTGSGGAAQGDNVFFQQACRVMLRNGIDLLLMATGKVSVGDLCRLVNSMPRSMEQVRSEEWQRISYCYSLLKQADLNSASLRRPRDYAVVLDYVLSEFPNLADRTRSSITATFTAFADLFQRGLLFDLLSNGTTLSPADIENGKIIVLDLPIKRYGDVGLVAQLVWKLMFQRLLERRAVTPDTRPAFIHVDEAQFFASGVSDALFASTCRSAKIAQVLLTQSISGFHTAYGGENGRALTDQLLANLSTKVIHATGDTITSSWAADLCGKSYRMLANFGGSDDGPADWSSLLGMGGGGRNTSGMSESLQYDIEPREFSYLRTGGIANDLLVDAIVLRSGQPFRASGKLWMPTMLSQR
ncbi:MAG: hypothetical protein JWM57_996 [Phycisphaerales bacterium]|nr:hypothetical protein [Phycisphaerales bacterium]